MQSQNRFLQMVTSGDRISIEQVDALVLDVQEGQLKLSQVLACALYALKDNVFAGDGSLFVAHCESVYKYKSAYAYRMAQAGKVYTSLSTIVEKEQWPKSISQAVVLSKLCSAQAVELWLSLCESGERESINSEKLLCYVRERIDAANARLMEESPVESQNRSNIEDAIDEVKGEEHVVAGTGSLPVTGSSMEQEEEIDPCDSSVYEESCGVEEPALNRDHGYGSPSDFPPFGIDQDNRRVMAAAGVRFFRLVSAHANPYIEEWNEDVCGWQQLLPAQSGTLSLWEDIIKKPGVCQC